MSNKSLAPLAKEWRWRRFGDCARLINGRAYSQEELLDSGTPVLRIQNLNGGDRWYYSKLSLPDEKYCDTGDLLYAWSASFGPYRFAGPKSIFHYHIWRVLPGDDLDKNFAFRLLEWITARIKAAAHGVAMLHMTKAGMEAWPIPVPPMPEQRRIAEILDKADALRTKRRAALAQLDSLIQSIFLDMFGDPATNPKGLSIERLGVHLLFVTSGGRGWAEFYAPAGSRFIRSLDVRMNYIGNEYIAFVAAPDNAEARRTRVKAGDVLLTITGSRIGRVAPVPNDLGGSYISQHVAILRVDSKRLEPTFLSFFLSLGAGGQRQIAKAQYGQTKPGLNFEQIRRFHIPVPTIELQREFAHRIAAVEKLRTSHRASLAELDALFASLQHRAFRGAL